MVGSIRLLLTSLWVPGITQ